MNFILFIVAFLTCSLLAVAPNKAIVYEKDSQKSKVLYHWSRKELGKGANRKIQTEFRALDGAVAVRETTVYEKNKFKRFEVDHLQTKEKGFVEIQGPKIHFEYTKDGETDKNDEDFVDNFVVASTIVDYLADHKETLFKGDSVDVRYGVLDRKETVGFKFSKTEEAKIAGLSTITLKMRPKSIFIAAIVDPLFFTMSVPDMSLREIVGRTLPKLQVDGKWKDLDADIVYTY